MADEPALDPLSAAAAAATARRLIAEVVEERARSTLGAKLQRPMARGLETLLRAIAPSTDAARSHVGALLAAIQTGGPPVDGGSGAESAASGGARAPLSPNLVAVLSAFFDPETPDGRDAITELEAAVADLDAAFASWHAFSAAGLPPGMGPIVKRMSQESLRRLEAELAKRIGKVLQAMHRLAKVFAALHGRRIKLAVNLAIAELEGPLGVRTAIGAGLALPGALNDAVQTVFGQTVEEQGSTFGIGNEVHEKLQFVYRSKELNNAAALQLSALRGQRPYLLMDHKVYYPPAQDGDLDKVAALHKDGTLLAMLFARYDEELFRRLLGNGKLVRSRWPQYREDVFDLRRAFLYEIKPVRSTALGVVQEYQYRQSFNIVHAAFLDLFDMVKAATAMKPSIRKMVGAIEQFSAADLALPGVGAVWTPFLTAFVAEGRVIAPFTLPNLDGLVLYLTFRSPDLARLLALSPLLARQIQRAVQEAMGRLAKALEYAILGIMAAVATLVLSVLIVELAAALGAASAGAAIATGGRLLLRRLIALVPASALVATGLMPSGARFTGGSGGAADEAAADAVVRGLEDVAVGLELRTESIVQASGAAVVVTFAESSQADAGDEGLLHADLRTDVELPFVRLNRFPVAGLPLLEVLLGLATLVAAYGLLRGFGGDASAGGDGEDDREDDGVVTVTPQG